MYRTSCPVRANFAATSSSSVDFPTPGSPASRMTAPGTRPPPSTRSSSSTPVGRKAAVVASTSAIRRAGSTTVVAAVVRATAVPVSSTVPQAWHSPQRPTHLAVVQPHSAHLYAGALDARDVFVAMGSTLLAGPDIPRLPGGGLQ